MTTDILTCPPLRDAIDALLQEAYDGPPRPEATWFVTEAPHSGVLGTIHELTAAQAWHRPTGLQHNVAEHVSHILFTLNHAMRCASAEHDIAVDWNQSWETGEATEANWAGLQRRLLESQLRMRMWVHADETFQTKESIARVIAAIAHGAYHLGAIRQVAALAMHELPGEASAAARRPL